MRDINGSLFRLRCLKCFMCVCFRVLSTETKSASSMHIKIIYGLVGLLIVVVASAACYIVFKRLAL